MNTLAIFGSTGSIGGTSLKILKKNEKKFKLLYLSAHNNYKKLRSLQKKFNPKKIFLTNCKANEHFALRDKKIILEKELFRKKKKIDFVITGISGYEAIEFNFKLLKISKNLLIANKETIICGGDIFINEAKKNNCNLIPIDSEHFCIYDFLKSTYKKKYNEIHSISLIASGGPLLNKKINKNESIKKILKHPNWKMGKLISVNSSNLSNKVLELFEAKFLFRIPNNKLKILIESTSNTHAIINFKNQISFSIMHTPTMEIPISAALNVPSKKKLIFNNLELKLRKPDTNKFPLVKIGYKILKKHNNVAMIFFTVLNQRLVNLYLTNNIKYGDINYFLVKAFNSKSLLNDFNLRLRNINDVLKVINIANNFKFK